jgi:hypothetical protein
VYARWLKDSDVYNEWMNPQDYETEEFQLEQDQLMEEERMRVGEPTPRLKAVTPIHVTAQQGFIPEYLRKEQKPTPCMTDWTIWAYMPCMHHVYPVPSMYSGWTCQAAAQVGLYMYLPVASTASAGPDIGCTPAHRG